MTNREVLKMLFNVDHNFDTNDYYKLVGGYKKEDIMFSQMWLNKECDTLPLRTDLKEDTIKIVKYGKVSEDLKDWIDKEIRTLEIDRIGFSKCSNPYQAPQIKDVIYNPPATIVFWYDNTKTVVKCKKDEIFDPHTGLAMATSGFIPNIRPMFFIDCSIGI